VSLDSLFSVIAELTERHSPSGAEEAVDEFLRQRLEGLGDVRTDPAGNVIVRLAGSAGGSAVAVTAHKDEIAAMVKRVEEDGRLALHRVGGSFPWVWGEGPVDVLGSLRMVPGVLSFGARHVSDESPRRTQQTTDPVAWKDAWVETKLPAAELDAAGVRPGSRVVLSAARKRPMRLGPEGVYVAGYALDDKAAVAALLELAGRIRAPRRTVELVFTAREEIGCHGALYYAAHTEVESLVALEVAPVADEYGYKQGADPVLVVADSSGPLHDGLGQELTAAAAAAGVNLRHALALGFGSDASRALSSGLVARTACLAFATDNTHGFEIAHLDAIESCVAVVERWLS